jgi:hypothetical protein
MCWWWVSALLLCEAGPVIGGDIDPVLRGEWPGFRRGQAQAVAVSGNYAYVAAGCAGVQVIDVSYPANPQRVGGYDTSGYADGVAVSRNFAYVAESPTWDGYRDVGGGLQVIDVSNPANPHRVGGYDTSGWAAGVAVSSDKAYVADGGFGLQVIDISNPANPQRVGGYDTSGRAFGVAVSGNYAYVADDDAGLLVIDVSNPANPPRVGATLLVSLESTNPVPPYATWDTAATNIQQAVDAAKAGDTVLVTNGVYAVGGRTETNEWGDLVSDRVHITKSIRLESVNGPDLTVIEGNQNWITNDVGEVVFSEQIRCV